MRVLCTVKMIDRKRRRKRTAHALRGWYDVCNSDHWQTELKKLNIGMQSDNRATQRTALDPVAKLEDIFS
jgi:hypothetical protein